MAGNLDRMLGSEGVRSVENIRHRLGTTQVHTPIEVGTASKFARLCQTTALIDEGLENTSTYIYGAMAGNLDRMLGSEGVRSVETR